MSSSALPDHLSHDLPPLDPRRHALFLDFDGTLVEIVDDPERVELDAGARTVLEALAKQMDGALALVSGRKVADLDRFCAPLRLPAAGVHGLERRFLPGGETEAALHPSRLDRVRARLAGFAEEASGVSLEDKGLALVLHYRRAPERAEDCRAAMARAVEGEAELTVMEGDHIVEVHPAGMDKGAIVTAMMEHPPFAGRIPVYLGDDTTDEFALHVVKEAGGLAIKVGSRDSVATHRLADVAAVHRWLADALAGEEADIVADARRMGKRG